MPISKVFSESTNYKPSTLQNCPDQTKFSSIYNRQIYQMLTSHLPSFNENINSPIDETKVQTNSNHNQDKNVINLGVIDKTNTPTVSHLLKDNPQLPKNYWEIIHAGINKNKQFTEMPEGSKVSIDLVTKELFWDSGQKESSLKNIANNSTIESMNSPEQILSIGKSVIIGTINDDSPTVSNLLKNNSKFSDNTWEIVFASVNKSKPYSSLLPGTKVSINPQTKELSFNFNSKTINNEETDQLIARNNKLPALSLSVSQELDTLQSNTSFSERLANSVKPFIGKPYNEIDCYQLVVRGIKSQGVQYNGKGGLRENMEQMAKEHGLPGNAYLNGEGLIEIAGNRVFSKSYYKINNSEKQADQIFNEMKPNLHQGMILSFSTPSRGHTGIVSQKDGNWTFINSGMIDNQVDTGNSSKRVGEEHLDAEIHNWFKLAKKRNESLKVSMGLLDENKLRSFNSKTDNLILSGSRF